MTAIPSREVTTTQVSAVTFGFYTEQEVRCHVVTYCFAPMLKHQRFGAYSLLAFRSKNVGTVCIAASLVVSLLWVQIRKLSAVRVWNPVLWDNLKHAMEGGLYDLAMGPLDHGQT